VLGFPLVLALVFSVLLSAILGMAIERAIYRPLKSRGGNSLALLLASLGVFTVLQNSIPLFFGDQARALHTPVLSPAATLWGATITETQVVIVGTTVILFLIVGLFFRFTRVGIAIRAVANDPGLAQVVGIDSRTTIMTVHALGSGLAAVAAVLVSLDGVVTPVMGAQAIFMGVVAVVLGGLGSLAGAVWAGLLLGISQSIAVLLIGSMWRDAVAYAVFFLVVAARPAGLWGRRLRSV
jgi:branched-chain amino acid transport system permease protein